MDEFAWAEALIKSSTKECYDRHKHFLPSPEQFTFLKDGSGESSGFGTPSTDQKLIGSPSPVKQDGDETFGECNSPVALRLFDDEKTADQEHEQDQDVVRLKGTLIFKIQISKTINSSNSFN